jgi:uncharacterized protein YciI
MMILKTIPKWLAVMALILAGTLVGAETSEGQTTEEMAIYYWGFFVRGPNQVKLPDEEAQAMQKGHIANLEKLHSEGKLLMAGPLGNAGNRRGVVVLSVRSNEEVQECFKEDPFVKNGRLTMQAYKWHTMKGVFKEAIQPIKMEEYRLGLVKKGNAWNADKTPEAEKLQEGHMKNIRKMGAAGILATAGPVEEAGDLRGIFLFRIKDEKVINEMITDDPAVAASRLAVELVPLYIAAGVIN